MIRSIATLAEPPSGNMVCTSSGVFCWTGHCLLPPFFPAFGSSLWLCSDKKEDSVGLHQFKCICMRFFAGTVHQQPSSPWLDELCKVGQTVVFECLRDLTSYGV